MDTLSIPEEKDFTCPRCGFIIKAPITKAKIVEHMKTHPEQLRFLCRLLKKR